MLNNVSICKQKSKRFSENLQVTRRSCVRNQNAKKTALANERAAKSERSAFQSGQFRFLHHTENSLKVMWGQLVWKAKEEVNLWPG